jgi:glutathione S-transferase
MNHMTREIIMKLYGFPPSPNTWKVRAVAAHLKLPLEFVLVDLVAGQSRTPEFLALNPTGRTPVLVDGSFTLWESNAIMQYLAGRTPNSLWPDDARRRADIMRWQSWQLAHWGTKACEPVIAERLVKRILNLGPPDAAVVAKALEAFDREAAALDGHLAAHRYLVGDEPTLADFAVAAPLFHAKPAALPLATFVHVQEWFGRVSALPAWRETAPQLAAAAA